MKDRFPKSHVIILSIFALLSAYGLFAKKSYHYRTLIQEVKDKCVKPSGMVVLHFRDTEITLWIKDTVPYNKRPAQIFRQLKNSRGEYMIINFPKTDTHSRYSVLFERRIHSSNSFDSTIFDMWEVKNPLEDPYNWVYPNDQIYFSKMDNDEIHITMLSTKLELTHELYWDTFLRKWVRH